MKARRGQKIAKRAHSSQIEEILQAIVANCQSPARLIELHYWSMDRGLPDIIRTIAGLDPKARGVVEAFVAMAGDPAAISATLDGAGRLTLSAPDVTQAMAVVSYVSERGEEIPQFLS